MSQLLLLPDPRPLDQRLGRKFFLNAPRRPGVYLMRDAADKILYIGKAKDLRQRLNHYRNANPDRMPRRHLRLIREVARIEFQFCPSETAALETEKNYSLSTGRNLTGPAFGQAPVNSLSGVWRTDAWPSVCGRGSKAAVAPSRPAGGQGWLFANFSLPAALAGGQP